MRDSLDEALLRQMEKSILLDTVYDERRISEEAMQALLRERCVEALWMRTRRMRSAFAESKKSSRSMRQSAQTAAQGTIFNTKTGMDLPPRFFYAFKIASAVRMPSTAADIMPPA